MNTLYYQKSFDIVPHESADDVLRNANACFHNELDREEACKGGRKICFEILEKQLRGQLCGYQEK